jgi:hypothetical protein
LHVFNSSANMWFHLRNFKVQQNRFYFCNGFMPHDVSSHFSYAIYRYRTRITAFEQQTISLLYSLFDGLQPGEASVYGNAPSSPVVTHPISFLWSRGDYNFALAQLIDNIINVVWITGLSCFCVSNVCNK